MKKRTLAFILLPVGLSLVFVPRLLSYFQKQPSVPAPATSPAGAAGVRPAVPVRTLEVRPTRLAEIVAATGSLRAEEGVELQTDIAGRIARIDFEEGMPVKSGQLLVKIHDADLQASLERAVARRRLAATRASRIEALFKYGGTNQQEYDAALSEVEVQEAEIRLIEAQIAKTEIRAPFDGIVGLRAVSLGAYVAPATRIATLQKIENIKVDFSIPERYAQRVQTGATLTFTIAGEPGTFTGSVYAIEPRIDPTTRTLVLRALADNSHARLRPGAFAQIELQLGEMDDALVVPAESVVPGLTNKTVYVVHDGKAALREVRTGTRTESGVQILEGLVPGDRVIVSGLQQMRQGVSVTSVN
jgi:membrane fusion protein (multidrug efflux system)